MKKTKKQKQPQIISQSKAAVLIDSPRQTINNLYRKLKNDKNAQYHFFTEDGKVNISHPDWKNYLDDRSGKESKKRTGRPRKNQEENNPQGQETGRPGRQSGKDSGDEGHPEWSREHALTGGYNPNMFYPQSTAQLKNLTDVVKLNLEMRIKLGDLMDRNILDAYIEKVAQGMMQFVNLGRTVSSAICRRLDRMGMEKEVEKVLNPKVRNIIEQVIATCNEIAGREIEIQRVRKKGKAAGRKKK